MLFWVCVPLLFVNVLNMWRTFRLKSVIRVSVGEVKTSAEEMPGAYATFGVAALPGRMSATSGSRGVRARRVRRRERRDRRRRRC